MVTPRGVRFCGCTIQPTIHSSKIACPTSQIYLGQEDVNNLKRSPDLCLGQCWHSILQLTILSHSHSPWDRKRNIYCVQHKFFREALLTIKFSILSSAHGFFASQCEASRVHLMVQSSRIIGNGTQVHQTHMSQLWVHCVTLLGFALFPSFLAGRLGAVLQFSTQNQGLI